MSNILIAVLQAGFFVFFKLLYLLMWLHLGVSYVAGIVVWPVKRLIRQISRRFSS